MRIALASLVALTAISVSAVAQMPLQLRGLDVESQSAWRAAIPLLQAALECRRSLPHVSALSGVLGVTNSNFNGQYVLAAPLSVFGLETRFIEIFEREDGGASYTANFHDAKLSEVARAAGLRMGLNRGQYIRVLNDRTLEASSAQAGQVQLVCNRRGNESP